jgi:hypothetical protein
MQEVRDALRREPFEPFRFRLSNGSTYEIHHPEFAALTRHSVIAVVPSRDESEVDEVTQCDLVHVLAMERINGQAPGGPTA